MGLLWQNLIGTNAVLSLFIVAFWLSERFFPSIATLRGRLAFGLMLGLASVLGMSMASEIVPGFKFDPRNSLVAASCFFGGPIPGAITAMMAAGFRLYLGGAGSLPGIYSIFLSSVIGTIGFFMIPHGSRSFVKFMVFSGFVTLGVLGGFVAVENGLHSSVFRFAGPPVLAFTFLTTTLIVSLINIELERRDALRKNLFYVAMVEHLPDCLNAKDLDGHFIAANQATAKMMGAKNAKELIGRSDYDFYPAWQATKYREEELAIMDSCETRLFEQPITVHTGQSGTLSTVKTPLLNEVGEVIGLVTHNRIITPITADTLRHQNSRKVEDFERTKFKEVIKARA